MLQTNSLRIRAHTRKKKATYMLTKDFRAKHTEVDWRAIEQMRHVLVHGYYTIKAEVLWNTIQEYVEPVGIFQ